MGSILEKYGWHEWLSKTNFSFQIGASHPMDMVQRAINCGYRSLAVNDYDGVYGVPRTWRARERLRKLDEDPGIRLHYGAEIHLEKDHDRPVTLQNTLVLIALSHDGYKNLCQILTYSHRTGKTEANVPLDHLLTIPANDLAAIVPMRGLIRRRKHHKLLKQCELLKEHFTGGFYLALSRHRHQSEDVWIPEILRLGKKLGSSFLLAQDAFFHEPEQIIVSDLLQAMRTNTIIGDCVQHMFPNDQRCLHASAVLEKRYRDLPVFESALKASAELSDQIRFDLDELRYHYPKEMIPGDFDAQTYLEKITWKNAVKMYGDPLPSRIEKQLDHELKLIADLEFADYFLTVWDIVRWAREQKILCQGRGSAANSAVCFALGVTSVDPSLFELLFERFISIERGDPPDIDVDFEHERREEVIQYIYRRYGRDKAAMVANVITFKRRGAIRFVGKALGIPESFQDQAAQILDARDYRGSPTQETIDRVQEDFADKLPETTEIPWEQWAFLAEKIIGFPRHLGLHSGGFVLSDKPIDRLVAQEPATMEDRTVIQWCKEDIEALGFFKVDVLGLGMLTALRKCLAMLESHYDTRFTLATIPQGDPQTYAMIQRADTVGTFQIESRAQMSMLPRLKPKDFYDLVIEIAIIRPGPIQGKMIHPFLRRRYGEEPVTFPDPRLEPILKRTMGVPIFQEQVMRIAMAVGGFSPGEANELRRNIGSFSLKGDVDLWIPKLIEGMRKNGITEDFIETIVVQLKGFASYGFPESHSASFALLAYASCFLKCHYPAPFFVSILNSQPMGFYEPHTLIQTVRLAGVPVFPPCINRSDWDTTLEKADQAPGGYGIRMGFRLVSCLGEPTAKAFLERRSIRGPWIQLEDFIAESRLSRVDLTALAAANALQCFGLDRRSALWISEAAPFNGLLEPPEQPVQFPKESRLLAIHQDFRSMSTSLREHPTKVIREEMWAYEVPVEKIVLAKDAIKKKKDQAIMIFGMVIVRQSPPTANRMLFATIEDETGLHNLVVNPAIYEKYRDIIENNSFLCVFGTVQKEQDAHSIYVRQFYKPRIKKARVILFEPDIQPDEPEITTHKRALVAGRNYT